MESLPGRHKDNFSDLLALFVINVKFIVAFAYFHFTLAYL
ncbi:putative membrane protein [Escherichia coli BCE030_MS-09]|nr:putative membrane protein [Escherichia coli BCE030_MS-09]